VFHGNRRGVGNILSNAIKIVIALFFACSNTQRNCQTRACYNCFDIDFYVVSGVPMYLKVKNVIRLYRNVDGLLIMIREVPNTLNVPIEEGAYKPIQNLIFILAQHANEGH
jgi:hypothetical protein